MEETLKVTNVLSDPTRFHIYQYLIESQKSVTVSDIAKKFEIHPNVARLHLSKLENIHLVRGEFKKTGKGGRPSRVYELSDQVIELSFPHRDYKLLSSIMLETFVGLGDAGKKALYRTGKQYGIEVIKQHSHDDMESLSPEEKIKILKSAGKMLGMFPDFNYDAEEEKITFHIANCPFKEVAAQNHIVVCKMHNAFIKGMLSVLFPRVQLIEKENMFEGCNNCSYIAKI